MNRFLTLMLLLVGAAAMYVGSTAEAALSIHVGRRGPILTPPGRRCCRPCPPPCRYRVALPRPPHHHCGKHRGRHHRHHGHAPRRCYNYTKRF